MIWPQLKEFIEVLLDFPVFTHAGANSVLVSLWNVADESIYKLMVNSSRDSRHAEERSLP
jgi:hypothetical protein